LKCKDISFATKLQTSTGFSFTASGFVILYQDYFSYDKKGVAVPGDFWCFTGNILHRAHVNN
jgi:hypothetical protein